MTPESARLLDASRERLTDAIAILSMGIYYVAAREAYLAAYSAAEALLLDRTGRIAKTHRGLRSEFSRVAQAEPAIDSTLTRFLAEAYELKATAAYGSAPKVAISQRLVSVGPGPARHSPLDRFASGGSQLAHHGITSRIIR